MSGAAGSYIVALAADAGISTDLRIEPGQDVHISGEQSLPGAIVTDWGQGGFAIQQFGALSLASLAVRGAIVAEQGGASLSLTHCSLLPGRDSAADRMLFHDAMVRGANRGHGLRLQRIYKHRWQCRDSKLHDCCLHGLQANVKMRCGHDGCVCAVQ